MAAEGDVGGADLNADELAIGSGELKHDWGIRDGDAMMWGAIGDRSHELGGPFELPVGALSSLS